MVSKDIKPEDALPKTAQASKLEFKIEVYISNVLRISKDTMPRDT